MKKLLSMVVLALLLCAVPAFADDTRTTEADDHSEEIESDVSVESNIGVSTRDGTSVETRTDARAGITARPVLRRENAGSGMNERASEERPVLAVRERLAMRAERLENMADKTARLATIRGELSDVKARIELKRTDLEQCKGKTSTDCKEVRKEAKSEVIEHLSLSADRILEHIARLKERVAASDVSADVKAKITADLDAQTAEVTRLKATLATYTEETDAATVKATARELREAWKDAVFAVNHAHGLLTQQRVEAVAKLEASVRTRIETQIANLKAAGKNTAELEAMLETYSSTVADAEEKLAEANTLLVGVSTSATKEADFKNAQSLRAEAQDLLREAKDTLKDMMAEIRVQAEIEASAEGDVQ